MADEMDPQGEEEQLAQALPHAAPSAEAQLRFLADHDPLTGLLNRRSFHRVMELALRHQDADPSWLIVLDLDEFKSVNDLFGLRAGDQVLRQVATRLRRIAPADAALARLGGDEFGCLVNSASAARIERLEGAIRGIIADRPFTYRTHQLAVRASLGSAAASPQETPGNWLDSADRALRAIRAGRRQRGSAPLRALGALSNVAPSGLPSLDLGDELCDASGTIRADALRFLAQPLHWLGRPDAPPDCELLLRLRTRSGQLLPPSRFLPYAHSQSLMPEIDRRVLAAALAWLEQQAADDDRGGRVCLNLSRPGLYDGRLIADAVAALARRPELARRICFELRDGGLIAQSPAARRHLAMLRDCGALLSLDGFGHAPLSLAGLRSLRPDVVKIDRTWLSEAGSSGEISPALTALIAIARDLGAVCAVVGVESIAQLRALSDAGCDMAQGYQLGRPVDLDPANCGLSSTILHCREESSPHHDTHPCDPVR